MSVAGPTPPQVACGADDYVVAAGALVHSVGVHAPGAHVHFLHGPSLTARSRRRLEATAAGAGAAITFHGVPRALVAGLPAPGYFAESTWYTVLLAEALPHLDRVLWIDADAVALAPLAPLWETDLGGAPVGAVTNVIQPDHVFHVERLGVAPGRYFNSGVLLFDLAALRAGGTGAELLAVARSRELPWADQDALNVVLHDTRRDLHPRFNAMNSLHAMPEVAAAAVGEEAAEEARRRPVIRHFEGPGPNKPWDRRCRMPGRDAWIAHRRASAFPRWARP